jgi:hypothetical protein
MGLPSPSVPLFVRVITLPWSENVVVVVKSTFSGLLAFGGKGVPKALHGKSVSPLGT